MDEDDYLEWRELIGSFMMVFAEVEFEIARALMDYSHLKYEDFRDATFSKRVNKLKNFVGSMGLPEEERVSLLSTLNAIESLATIRNLIAHNPVDLALESVFEEQTWLEIRSLRNQDQVIKKEDLKEKLKELTIEQESLQESLSYASFDNI